jgi:hypothetical protein
MLLLAVLPSCCLAQKGDRLLRSGVSRSAQLMEEITLLQRIVPLALTDAQLDQLLKLYAANPPAEEPGMAEAMAKLQAMKQRLLAGTPLVATDLATLRDAMRQAARGWRDEAPAAPAPAPPPAGLTPLEQAAWDLLMVPQRAALLGDVRGPAANNQKADAALAKRALQVIKQMLALDEAQWLAARDRLAAALAAGAGVPNAPAVDNCRKLFVEFLDRVRKMNQADFARRQDELGAELQALLPPGTNLVVALAEFEPRLIHDAMAAGLLHPRVPDLLQQIKTARATPQAP